MVASNKEVLGKKAVYNVEGLKIEVEIKDVKSAYGVLRYLIAPVSGSGEKWVIESSVKLV